MADDGEYKKILPRLKARPARAKKMNGRKSSVPKSPSFIHYKRRTPIPFDQFRLQGVTAQTTYAYGFETIPDTLDQNETEVMRAYHRTVILSPDHGAEGLADRPIGEITAMVYQTFWLKLVNAGVSEVSIRKYQVEVAKVFRFFKNLGITHPSLDLVLDLRMKVPSGKKEVDPEILSLLGASNDVHTETASKIFSTPPSEVTPAQRKSAMTANFATLYGSARPEVSTVKKRRTSKERAIEEKKIRVGTRIQYVPTGVTNRVARIEVEKKRYGVKEKMIYWDTSPGPNWTASRRSVRVESVLGNPSTYKVLDS